MDKKVVIILIILLLGIFLFVMINAISTVQRTQTSDFDWENDEVVLMQHESEGYYQCFGCNSAIGNEPTLCVDPANVMKMVEETEERYCNNDFEILD
tara:strand:- start:293 stop:583 length:291 start_codon:yes stop_codon:yes gene_type:complete